MKIALAFAALSFAWPASSEPRYRPVSLDQVRYGEVEPNELIEMRVFLGIFEGAAAIKINRPSAQAGVSIDLGLLSLNQKSFVTTRCTSGNSILTIGGCGARIRGSLKDSSADLVIVADEVDVLDPPG